jgi:hypothetical protein
VRPLLFAPATTVDGGSRPWHESGNGRLADDLLPVLARRALTRRAAGAPRRRASPRPPPQRPVGRQSRLRRSHRRQGGTPGVRTLPASRRKIRQSSRRKGGKCRSASASSEPSDRPRRGRHSGRPVARSHAARERRHSAATDAAVGDSVARRAGARRLQEARDACARSCLFRGPLR